MNTYRQYALPIATMIIVLLAGCSTLDDANSVATDLGDIDLSVQGYADPNQGNPIVPGLWADPSIYKFGDTWYIYATAEGGDRGAFAWKSTDRQNWTLVPLTFTNATITEYWAPSVLADNGKYYMYYSKALNGMFAAEAPTPEGPWTETQLIGPSGEDIDPQPFVDDDGTTYLYWGTAGVSKVAELSADRVSFAETPRQLSVPNFYEGPFVIKRGGKYILTYSEGWFFNETYKVRYATADSPFGPFTEGTNSPILSTTGDIHGPGHHSLFSEGGQDYILYHRHQIPYNPFFETKRQLAIDPIGIGDDGSVADVVPTHEGVNGWGWRFEDNLARGAVTTASSSSADSDAYLPSSAVDENNATRWAAAGFAPQWLQVDLGSVQTIGKVSLAFEFLTEWTQYKIESSIDGNTWSPYIDETSSTSQKGIVSHNKSVSTRYLRVTITGFENFRLPSITEFKVFQ